jgi:hypothetical protein
VIARTIRAFVQARARGYCEYCGLPQDLTPLVAFHVEHVVPRKHGGGDEPENLALSCFHCNLHKGSNLTGIDPVTGAVVPLFDPRRQTWVEHLAFEDAVVVGLTPVGRATVHVMRMNAPSRTELRTELQRIRGSP